MLTSKENDYKHEEIRKFNITVLSIPIVYDF